MRTSFCLFAVILFLSCSKPDCPVPQVSSPPLTVYNLNDGLIAYYPFNGNAVDETVNTHDGIVNGAVLTTDRNGNSNKAYYFDGNLDYINIGNAPDIKRYQSSFTISAWIKLSSYSSSYGSIILSNRNHNTTPISGSIINVSGVLSSLYKKLGYVQNATPTNDIYTFDYIASDKNLDLDTWTFITITYNYSGQGANEAKMYINGVLSSSKYMSEIIDILSGPTYIGCEPNLSPVAYSFNGSMDEIRIYNRVLADAEVLKLYQVN